MKNYSFVLKLLCKRLKKDQSLFKAFSQKTDRVAVTWFQINGIMFFFFLKADANWQLTDLQLKADEHDQEDKAKTEDTDGQADQPPE